MRPTANEVTLDAYPLHNTRRMLHPRMRAVGPTGSGYRVHLRGAANRGAGAGEAMRYLAITMALAVAPGSGDFADPWAPGMACGEYRAQADNYATALQRIADCMDDRDLDEGRACVERVLAETEE